MCATRLLERMSSALTFIALAHAARTSASDGGPLRRITEIAQAHSARSPTMTAHPDALAIATVFSSAPSSSADAFFHVSREHARRVVVERPIAALGQRVQQADAQIDSGNSTLIESPSAEFPPTAARCESIRPASVGAERPASSAQDAMHSSRPCGKNEYASLPA